MATRSVARSCRSCHKRCHRGCKILTSPSKLAKIAFEFLDRWVTRRTIVTFSMLEALASIGAVLFFCAVRDISDLGFFIQTSFFYVFVMFIRVLSSCLGFVAGFFRKVKLTKFYFALLSFNIPMTFLVCVPLWRCSCTCDRHEFLSLRKDNKLKDPDCRVLQQFASSLQTQGSRRLLATGSDGEPATRSHALAVAKAVADTVGTASTKYSMLRDWQAASMRALLNIRYFFSLASTPPPSPSSHRVTGQRRSALRNRILAASHQHRRAGNATTNTSRGSASSVFRRLRATKSEARGPKLQYPILSYFDVTEAGIGWRSQIDVSHDEWFKENCDADGTDLSSEKIRTLMEEVLRKWTWDDDKQGLNFKKTCENKHHWCEMLTGALSRCVKDEQCGAVQGWSLIEKVVMAHDFDGIEIAEDASRFRTCRYPLPIYPRLLKGDENKTGNIYFQKKETVTMKAMMLNQFEEDSAADKCYAIVTLVMMSLLFLDMISVPMFIIVQKFLMRRCGDFLSRERQFSVQFSSEEEDSEDDFTISSGTWMGGSPSRNNSGLGSSFQSMREGEGTFQPKSPSRAARKGTMPEHWKAGAASISGVELSDAVSNKSAESGEKREGGASVYLAMDATMSMDDVPPGPSQQGGASPSKKKAGQPPPSTYSWG